MTTQLGKELKKLRIDLGITLMEMANQIKVSAAFLSSIETGRKRVPDHFLDTLASNFEAVAQQRSKYEVLINQARQDVRLTFNGSNKVDAELATALARRFGSLSPEEKEQLMRIVEEQ